MSDFALIIHERKSDHVRRVLKDKQFWGVLIAVTLLGFSFKEIRWADLTSLSHRFNFWYVIPVVFLGVLLVISRAVRWQGLVRGAKHIPLRRVIPLYAAGQVLNTVMPALTGQVGRVILFSRKEKLKKTVVFSTFLMELVFDAITLLIFMGLTSFAFAFPNKYRPASYALGVVCILAFAILYGFLVFKEPIGRFGKKHIRHRWRGFYITVKKFSHSFATGVTALKSSTRMATSLSLSILGWILHGAMVYLLFQAFGFDLPFAASFVILVINTLLLMIPITPGNAGTFEIIVITALKWFGINRTDAALYAIALHILDVLPIFAVAAFYMRAQHVSLRQLTAQNAEISADERPVLATAKEGR